jgi:folylpolyglutamate synthase/dihydropteroate synthase
VPAAGDIYATLAPSPRATPLEHLVELVSEIRPESREHGVFAIADPMAALEQALARHDVVCVAGSIFLAGAVRDALMRRAILR